jgi:hypothetical protein
MHHICKNTYGGSRFHLSQRFAHPLPPPAGPRIHSLCSDLAKLVDAQVKARMMIERIKSTAIRCRDWRSNRSQTVPKR